MRIDELISTPSWPEDRSQVPQVRIEVTFRCGKHCAYCRPSGEGVLAEDLGQPGCDDVRPMTIDELAGAVEVLVAAGAHDFKLTGGDPMLRPDIVEVIRRIKSIPGVSRLDLVTRHPRGGELAAEMRDAGLDLLNFSIDSLDSRTWTQITGVSGLEQLTSAVRTAAATGIALQLNAVVLSGVNEHQIPDLMRFAADLGAELKLLDLITDISPMTTSVGEADRMGYVDLVPFAERLAETAVLGEVVTQGGGLGHPMPRFVMPSGLVVTVKSARLGAYYGSICVGCGHFPCCDALMALRLTPNGMLQFCLLRGDNLVDIVGLARDYGRPTALAAAQSAIDIYRQASPMTGAEVAALRALPTIAKVAIDQTPLLGGIDGLAAGDRASASNEMSSNLGL